MVIRYEGGFRLARAFVRAAWRYWVTVWPVTATEARKWRQRATEIPDDELRAAALRTLSEERGNLEGAAAFGVLAPRERRAALVRALVAFQAIYDYVDTLVELPEHADERHSRRLHRALRDTLEPGHKPRDGYYAGNDPRRDGGYLATMVETCRSSVAGLPSAATVMPYALVAVGRMIDYQALNHGEPAPPIADLARWAVRETPAGTDFEWWETAAAAASSLVVFALLALATADRVAAEDAERLAAVYLPAGALHVLLDSVVDREADLASGDHSLVAHYSDRAAERARLVALASRAFAGTDSLAAGSTHRLIISAMTSFYLTAPTVEPEGRLDAARILATLGPLRYPTTIVLRLRHAAARCRRVPAHVRRR